MSKPNQRIEQLDSLRGLASLAVVLFHFFYSFPFKPLLDPAPLRSLDPNSSDFLLNLLAYTPLRVLWSGQEAVIFFFVLSGFVLALPFLSAKTPRPYFPFAIKRVFRIYPPYLSAVFLALILWKFCYSGPIPELSEPFNKIWSPPMDWPLIRSHLIFLASFEHRLDPALWSLVHEMRISLIFPVLFCIVQRVNWKTSLLLVALFGYSARLANNLVSIVTTAYWGAPYVNDYCNTLGYLGMFLLGALIAKHRNCLIARFSSWSKPSKYLFFLAAILAYTNKVYLADSGIFDKTFLQNFVRRGHVLELITSLGVASLIIISLSSTRASRFLFLPFLQFTGKISFSLYLYHYLCLLTFIHLFYHSLSPWAILAGTVISSYALATCGYYAVELPFMKLGASISKKFSRPANPTQKPEMVHQA